MRRQYARVAPPLLGTAPFWRAPARVGTLPDAGVRAWAVPSLLAKPVTYALLRLAREPHDGGLGSGRSLWLGALPALAVLLVGALKWEGAATGVAEGRRRPKQG